MREPRCLRTCDGGSSPWARLHHSALHRRARRALARRSFKSTGSSRGSSPEDPHLDSRPPPATKRYRLDRSDKPPSQVRKEVARGRSMPEMLADTQHLRQRCRRAEKSIMRPERDNNEAASVGNPVSAAASSSSWASSVARTGQLPVPCQERFAGATAGARGRCRLRKTM